MVLQRGRVSKLIPVLVWPDYGLPLPPPIRVAMPLLFSYGTLREHDTQREVFGKIVEGVPDQLVRFDLSDVKVRDEQGPHYPNLTYSGRSDSRVNGLVFDVSEADLVAADTYLNQAGYRRQPEKLASGRMAWVYLNAGFI